MSNQFPLGLPEPTVTTAVFWVWGFFSALESIQTVSKENQKAETGRFISSQGGEALDLHVSPHTVSPSVGLFNPSNTEAQSKL